MIFSNFNIIKSDKAQWLFTFIKGVGNFYYVILIWSNKLFKASFIL